MKTRTRRIELVKDSTSLLISKAYTAEAEVSIEVEVADDAVNQVVDIALTFARMKWLIINSDAVVTVGSFDGASAGNSFSLVANSPVQWFDDDPVDNPIDNGVLTKITAVKVSNSSGGAATIKIEAGYDPTP